MNWKDELMADHAEQVHQALVGQLPKFVRGHRVATLGTRQPDGSYTNEAVPVDRLEDAEVITSWTGETEEPPVVGPNDWSALAHQPETYHRPILDLDFDAALVPSTSADHHHLYLDKVLKWSDYVKLLDVLAEVGIIEPGYRDASIAREFTSVRLPWVTKP